MNGRYKPPSSIDVIDYYGDRKICGRCGASVSTYGDACTAPLDVQCQGFDNFEMMLRTVAKYRSAR
jgi:hypothetical protein